MELETDKVTARSRAGRRPRCRRLPSRKARLSSRLPAGIDFRGRRASQEGNERAEPKADEKLAKDDKKAEPHPAKSEGSAKSATCRPPRRLPR